MTREIHGLMHRLRRVHGRTMGGLLSAALLGACGSSSEGPRESAMDSGDGVAKTNAVEEGRPDPGVGPPGSSAAPPQEQLPPPGEAWVIFDGDTVTAELARTPAEREQGLMYREELSQGRGMLFIFQDAQYRSFWMRNTFLPLDIAYLDETLRIVDIQAMEPESEEGHPSAQPAMFALEVPRGWFSSHGIRVGDQARLVFGPGG